MYQKLVSIFFFFLFQKHDVHLLSVIYEIIIKEYPFLAFFSPRITTLEVYVIYLLYFLNFISIFKSVLNLRQVSTVGMVREITRVRLPFYHF